MSEFFKSRFEKHIYYSFLSLKFSLFISILGRGGYGFFALLRMTGGEADGTSRGAHCAPLPHVSFSVPCPRLP